MSRRVARTRESSRASFAAVPEPAFAPFELVEPSPERESPVVVEVPHASLAVPARILAQIDAPASHLARDADLHVDSLYADAPLEGATLLVARASRYAVDLNRAEDDVDDESVEGAAAQGAALAPRAASCGASRAKGPASSRARSRAPSSNAASTRSTGRTTPCSGACSSESARGSASPSSSRGTRCRAGRAGRAETRGSTAPTSSRARAGARRPTTDSSTSSSRTPGAKGGRCATTSRTAAAIRRLRTAGPFERVHAVQVELARRLYMDEETLATHAGFDDVRGWCRTLVARLRDIALR